jgi:hypothetical protein
MSQLFSTTKTFLIGGMFLGISYVIATTWGSFFTAYSQDIMERLRCDKYKDDVDRYNACLKEESISTRFFTALATTFVLALVALLIVWLSGLKNVPSKPSVFGAGSAPTS